MTRDYAKSNSSKRKTQKQSSYLGLWLFVLLLFIAFTVSLVYLGKKNFQTKLALPQKTVTIVTQPKKAAEVTAVPKFDFYTILPQKKRGEVKAEYELGIAKVKDYTAADRLKAELTLLGFTVNVRPLRKNNLQEYYVSVGPYENQEDATIDLEKLKQNKIHAELKACSRTR